MEEKSKKGETHRAFKMGSRVLHFEVLCREKGCHWMNHEKIIHECTLWRDHCSCTCHKLQLLHIPCSHRTRGLANTYRSISRWKRCWQPAMENYMVSVWLDHSPAILVGSRRDGSSTLIGWRELGVAKLDILGMTWMNMKRDLIWRSAPFARRPDLPSSIVLAGMDIKVAPSGLVLLFELCHSGVVSPMYSCYLLCMNYVVVVYPTCMNYGPMLLRVLLVWTMSNKYVLVVLLRCFVILFCVLVFWLLLLQLFFC